MDELRKASILLKHLSPGEREQILGRFDRGQREQLREMIAEASEVSHAELAGIVSEYQSWLRRVSKSSEPESSVSKESDERAVRDFDCVWKFLSEDAQSIANRLINEPATVVAAVLCQLQESAARKVYASLSEERQAAVVARLPVQREMNPIVKQELSGFLSEASTGTERDNQRANALLARLVGS